MACQGDRRSRLRGWLAGSSAIAALAAMALALPATAAASVTQSDNSSFSVTAGSLTFGTPVPNVPDTLSAVTLNGSGTQTSTGQMNNFQVVDATGSGSGWNLTVNGNSGTGLSAVFRQYCPNSTCGTDSGPGYVTSGASLPAGSLTLSTTGATLTGGSGTAPTNQCSSTACAMDTSSPTKIVSAATSAGMGTWTETGFGAASVSVAIPSSIKVLNTGEYYRTDLLWTLATGP